MTKCNKRFSKKQAIFQTGCRSPLKHGKNCNPNPRFPMQLSSADRLYEHIDKKSPVEKDVLNVIIWYGAKFSRICPSQSTIAALCGISVRYVNKIIGRFNREGLLGKWYRHMKSCYYNLPSLFFNPEYRNRFAKLLPNIAILPYSFAFISLLFSNAYSELPEGVFKTQFLRSYLKENYLIKSYVRNIAYSLPRAREASEYVTDCHDLKTVQSSRGEMKTIGETTKNLFATIASQSEKTFLIKREREQGERNSSVTEPVNGANPDCLAAFSAEAIEYAGKELQAQRSLADPATWFICKCREYDRKQNQEKERKMSFEVPKYINEIKSLDFTDFGKVKLCAFPEEAIRFADKEMQKASFVDKPGNWFIAKCKEYCKAHNFLQDYMTTTKLLARYKFSLSLPLLRSNRVNRTHKREKSYNSNNSTHQTRPLNKAANLNVGERNNPIAQSHSAAIKSSPRPTRKTVTKPNAFYEEWKQTDEGIAYVKLETLGTEYAGVAFKKFLHSEVGQSYYESVSRFEKDCLDIARSSFEDPTEIALKRCHDANEESEAQLYPAGGAI